MHVSRNGIYGRPYLHLVLLGVEMVFRAGIFALGGATEDSLVTFFFFD
jgi:hypothetical protein